MEHLLQGSGHRGPQRLKDLFLSGFVPVPAALLPTRRPASQKECSRRRAPRVFELTLRALHSATLATLHGELGDTKFAGISLALMAPLHAPFDIRNALPEAGDPPFILIVPTLSAG